MNPLDSKALPLSWLLLLTTALAMTGAGCRSPDDFSRIVNEPMPLSEGTRKEFGTVALLPSDAVPDVLFKSYDSLANAAPPWAIKTFKRLDAATRIDNNFDKPDKRELNDPMNYYDVGRLLCVSVAAGAAAVAEAVVSTAPQAQLDASQAAVRQALEEEPLQPLLEAKVQDVAAARHCEQLVKMPGPLLASLKSQTTTNRIFVSLTNAVIDSVLLVRVHRQQFGVVRRLNPPMIFAITVDVYIFRAVDGSVSHFNSLEYRSGEHKITTWGANDAKRLRAEIRFAQSRFADSILTELFDLGPTPGQ